MAVIYSNDFPNNTKRTNTLYIDANTDLGTTVYGATLDLVTGVMTVWGTIVDLGTLNWGKDTTTRPADNATIHAFYATLSDCKIIDNNSVPEMLSSVFNADTIISTDYGGNNVIKDCICSGADKNRRIWVYGSVYNEMSTADFKTAMSGVQLAYELATPYTVQLTPTQVRSLLGTNNVWSDSGKMASVVYVRDINAVIGDILTRLGALEPSRSAKSVEAPAEEEEKPEEEAPAEEEEKPEEAPAEK